MSTYRVCPADPDVLPLAMTWAATEGWEPGVGDIPAFAAVDSAGWFSARDESGRIVTTLAGLKYSADFGFIGLYITSPAELRGHGIGKRVWDPARERLAECAVVGLDGVIEREQAYARDGFVRSHLTTRFAGHAGTIARALAPEVGSTGDRATAGNEVRIACPDDVSDLGSYEQHRAVFPAERLGFISQWLLIDRAVSLTARGPGDDITGWATIRPSVSGWRIGPLFADDHATAVRLLATLATVPKPDATVYIDVPEPNQFATALVRRIGLVPSFACVRMYAGNAPDLNLARVYANTTFELG